jgi:diadenosine tetraphosphate (Ap4A) HIT family hydrolase
MEVDPMQECLVCQKHRGLLQIPGGAIFENETVYISHAQLWGDEQDHYLGHLFVEPKRHVPKLSDLSDDEAQLIGLYVSRIARALEQTQGMEHVYAFAIGDHVPHVHIHVIGRYPGAPRDYWGPKVDEWPDAPRGGETEIEALVCRLREFMTQYS